VDGTTKERVRIALRMQAGYTEQDDLLGQLITQASAQVEAYLGRDLLAATKTEYHNLEGPEQRSLWLKSPPVSSVTSLAFDPASQWDGSESVYAADDYILNPDTGEMRFRFEPHVTVSDPAMGFRAWRVVYAGGLAASTSALISAYPAIAAACDLQVATLYHRSADPQTEQRSFGGAAVKVSEPLGLCRAAREACGHHRLIRWRP
jgi:uncharacterized phiE125 gp8 family phage protein